MSDNFKWSSPEGYELVRRILRTTPVPYTPHDYQLEGLCKSLDGIHLFAITRTGSGKTAYYSLYMLVVLAVVANPALCPTASFPKNPCLLVVCPTVPSQLEMAENMCELGLDTLAINAETRLDALRQRNEELWTTARKRPNIILTGPEQLTRREFEKALQDKEFYGRVCGTGFDEVHLLNTWGASFRKDFQQMGFLKARMKDQHNHWILTSATVRDGPPFDNICRLLGLNNNFHLIRRSSHRPDIQLLFRDLVSPISGDSFPELHWIIEGKRPTVIYAKSISLGSRIYADLLRKASLTVESKRIRMYNSLNFEAYNAETRELMKKDVDDDEYCQILIGTDTLSVGVGMRGRVDAVCVGDIVDTDEEAQKIGRVNRKNEVSDARGVVYVSAAVRKAAEKLLADNAAGTLKPSDPPLDLSMPQLIVAKCKVAALNKLYNNPASDTLCTCPTCEKNPPPLPSTSCNCSGCTPETLPIIKPPPRPSKINHNIPKSQRLSKLQKTHGTEHLVQLRFEIWRKLSGSQSWMLPPTFFLSDTVIAAILNNYVMLKTQRDIERLIRLPAASSSFTARLLELLGELKPEFTAIAAKRKAENRDFAREAQKTIAHEEPQIATGGFRKVSNAANRASKGVAEESDEEEDEDVEMEAGEVPSGDLPDVVMQDVEAIPQPKPATQTARNRAPAKKTAPKKKPAPAKKNANTATNAPAKKQRSAKNNVAQNATANVAPRTSTRARVPRRHFEFPE
ncbi:ATP-dependent DNA helicase Q1 [Favolaschia claudopus]|uniref:ATP-dependent DNA helicase Q1 n=1 Tax=Favolaschia claudopus TaxID=2862362 RepID=A0AAV9Z361_9AGAR